MKTVNTYKIKNEDATRDFAREVAKNLEAGDVIALIGDLGTGKTAITRYIAEALGIEDRISSPTFTIVKEHKGGRLDLFHFDVYRLAGDMDVLSGQQISGEEGKSLREHAVDELYNIGADEYFDGRGVSIVEWADLIEEALPERTKYIFIEYADKEEQRVIKCTF